MSTSRSRYRRPESVLVVVTTRAREVLLLRRRKPAQYWQSVTGSLEWGESVEQAARRELSEETGIRVVDGLMNLDIVNDYTIAAEFGHRYAPGVERNKEYVWALRLDRQPQIVLNRDEHLEYRWMTVEEALALASSPTDRAAIRRSARTADEMEDTV